MFVDFVAALSGNLSSASALGTLYCASAIGARASPEAAGASSTVGSVLYVATAIGAIFSRVRR